MIDLIKRSIAVLFLVPATVPAVPGAGAAANAASCRRPPTITLTSPPSGVGYDAPATIDLRASASAPSGTVTRVEFYRNDARVGTDRAAPYSRRLTGVRDGRYRFSAVAYDNAGRRATSNVSTVVVTTPPTVTVRGVVRAGVTAGCLVLTHAGVTYTLFGGDPDVVRVGARVEITGQLPRDVFSICMQGRILYVLTARRL